MVEGVKMKNWRKRKVSKIVKFLYGECKKVVEDSHKLGIPKEQLLKERKTQIAEAMERHLNIY